MKHVGRHGDRKVAIVYKTVPDQDHMALVVYTESMGVAMHNALMKSIESPEGQAANELAEVLHRNLFSDGRMMLETIHKEGMLKKAECKQIIVMPDAKNSVRLDELNRILAEIESGEDAAAELANLDKNRGLVHPRAKLTSETLNDSSTAQQMLTEATTIESKSKSLLAESKRLKEKAYEMDESLRPPKRKYTKGKTVAKKSIKKVKAKTKA